MPEAELSLLFLRPLNKLGVRYIVSGSVASMLYGEPRFTNDVDLVVFLRHDDIPRLAAAFPSPEFYLPPAEIIAAEIARPQSGQFNALHVATGFKADIYTTGRDEFNAWAFRNARKMEFKGELIVVAPPECVIVRKLEYTAKAGQTSICATSVRCWRFRVIRLTGRSWTSGFTGAGWKRSGKKLVNELQMTGARSPRHNKLQPTPTAASWRQFLNCVFSRHQLRRF